MQKQSPQRQYTDEFGILKPPTTVINTLKRNPSNTLVALDVDNTVLFEGQTPEQVKQNITILLKRIYKSGIPNVVFITRRFGLKNFQPFENLIQEIIHKHFMQGEHPFHVKVYGSTSQAQSVHDEKSAILKYQQLRSAMDDSGATTAIFFEDDAMLLGNVLKNIVSGPSLREEGKKIGLVHLPLDKDRPHLSLYSAVFTPQHFPLKQQDRRQAQGGEASQSVPSFFYEPAILQQYKKRFQGSPHVRGGGGGDSLEGHPSRRRNPSFSFSSPRPSKTTKFQDIQGKSLFGGGGGSENDDDDWKDI
jgi:hypothetical protein